MTIHLIQLFEECEELSLNPAGLILGSNADATLTALMEILVVYTMLKAWLTFLNLLLPFPDLCRIATLTNADL